MLRLEQSPSFVHTADSFTSFRSQLKTYMFARHFVAGPLSAPPMPLPGLAPPMPLPGLAPPMPLITRSFARYKFVALLTVLNRCRWKWTLPRFRSRLRWTPLERLALSSALTKASSRTPQKQVFASLFTTKSNCRWQPVRCCRKCPVVSV